MNVCACVCARKAQREVAKAWICRGIHYIELFDFAVSSSTYLNRAFRVLKHFAQELAVAGELDDTECPSCTRTSTPSLGGTT